MGTHPREGKLGKWIRITLTSTPSAGYSWQAEFDPGFFDLESHTSRPVRAGVIGGKSRETFVFLPKKVGETEVTLRYKRPWEKEVLKVEDYRIRVHD